MKSKFTIGYENNGKLNRGWIFLNGIHFANFYTMPNDWGSTANKVVFNRDKMAFEMNYPVMEPFNNIEEMLAALEKESMNWE